MALTIKNTGSVKNKTVKEEKIMLLMEVNKFLKTALNIKRPFSMENLKYFYIKERTKPGDIPFISKIFISKVQ